MATKKSTKRPSMYESFTKNQKAYKLRQDLHEMLKHAIQVDKMPRKEVVNLLEVLTFHVANKLSY